MLPLAAVCLLLLTTLLLTTVSDAVQCPSSQQQTLSVVSTVDASALVVAIN